MQNVDTKFVCLRGKVSGMRSCMVLRNFVLNL